MVRVFIDYATAIVALFAIAAALSYRESAKHRLSLLREYTQYGMTPEELRQCLSNYSEYLCFATGGRLSKIGYDLETMEAVTRDYWDERNEVI